MDFSHYTTRPVEMAVALANTQGIDYDDLSSTKDMQQFLDTYRELWHGAASPAKAADLDAVRDLRAALRSLFSAEDEEEAARRVNDMLGHYGATPRLSMHSGTPHLHFEPLETSMVCWLGATTSMGLASVIVEHGVERFGVCSSETCNDVYVDTSRNKSRLHCSSTCSTREAVAAYRARKSEEN